MASVSRLKESCADRAPQRGQTLPLTPGEASWRGRGANGVELVCSPSLPVQLPSIVFSSPLTPRPATQKLHGGSGWRPRYLFMQTRFDLEPSAAPTSMLMCLWHGNLIFHIFFRGKRKKTSNKKKYMKINCLSISERICLRKCHGVEMQDLVLFLSCLCVEQPCQRVWK